MQCQPFKNSLKILNCSGTCLIDDKGISELNLIELNTSYNTKINKIDHMKDTLKILRCEGECAIDDQAIFNLKLDKLYSKCNNKIKIKDLYEKYNYMRMFEKYRSVISFTLPDFGDDLSDFKMQYMLAKNIYDKKMYEIKMKQYIDMIGLTTNLFLDKYTDNLKNLDNGIETETYEKTRKQVNESISLLLVAYLNKSVRLK